MVIKDYTLLKNLEEIRDELRQEQLNHGNPKLICSDEALKDMAKHKPLRINDFLAISGLDKDFIERYSHLFLDVIQSYVWQDQKSIKVSKEAYKVLDRYKDRLSNISRTNPNLYMGRIVQKKHFDLMASTDENQLFDFLSGKKKELKFKDDEEVRKLLTLLYREVNKAYKDTGTYDLYIAYPYVAGVYKKDHFTIKAPMAYLPVSLVRHKKTFTLSLDKDKDIVLNRDLILTISKINHAKFDEALPDVNDLSIKSLKDIIIPYYKKHGLDIKKEKLNHLMAFENQVKDDFLKQKKDVFQILPYITLGRFELFSSMIQKDMADILEKEKYNDLLEGLIDDKNIYSEALPISIDVSSEGVDESKLSYINDINFAQEKVIEMIDQESKVVIWGPPGTGKSQTITNLIAHQVLKGENVLVVSEKRVALDVIYSRLGDAAKNTMFIDDASNKGKFYQQLNAFLSGSTPKRFHNNDLYKLEEEINQLTLHFDRAVKLMYQDSKDDIKIYKLYHRYIKDKDVLIDLTPKRIYKILSHGLNKPSFSDIDHLEEVFDKDQKLHDFIEFHRYNKSYSWFKKLETKLARSSQLEFKVFVDHLEDFYKRYDSAWFIKKRQIKKSFLRRFKMHLKFLSVKSSIDKKLLKAFINDRDLAFYLLNHIKKINKIKSNYFKLDQLSLLFLDIFISHSDIKEHHRQYLFDAYYTGFLEYFKAINQKHLYIIDQYESKMDELQALMEEKKEVSKESFLMQLYKNALALSNTKRIMDIRRILESPRLPSIKSFFDIFHLELFSHIKIWLLTPEVVSTIVPLNQHLFDLVIFDEASQMYVEKGIPSIYRAKRAVIAGDPKQLRPSSLGVGRIDEEDDFYEDEVLKNISYDAKSLLDLARYKYKEALLNYHYRSYYQELIEFSNHAFYDGKLIISPNVIEPKEPPISYVYVKDGIFYQRKNQKEANQVIELLKKVLREKESDESIGIITFNSSQRDLIMNEMDELLFKRSVHQKRLEKELFRQNENEDQSLFVKNIENVQGDERDIIIFSMAYGKDTDGIVKRRFGWLNHEGGQNRLNVAITRAKKKIFFVSSLYPEELKVDDLSGQGPKLLKDFMRYCYYVSQKKKDLAKEILNQLYKSDMETKTFLMDQMTQDLSQKLTKLKYEVHQGIGIGQFNLDLALYDPEASSYKLGIICDLTNENDSNSRKELFHQEKFLKARGWEVFRVFHMQWYENSQKVMKAIKNKLKSL
ncbi:HRDC domain-containing protein [Mycoplasmatota bacterium]|nr:HRDC domain-containing protein [Mycoplasmatota bacterium]